MSDRNAQIVDMLLKAHTRNEQLEEENEAALTELQDLRRTNKALEEELTETRRLLKQAEKAIPSQALPQELILEIAHILASSHSHRTLSSLSLVSRVVHEDVVPVLFETMICDNSWAQKWAHKKVDDDIKDKWKHARCVVISHCDRLLADRKNNFPNLVLGLTANRYNMSPEQTGFERRIYMAGAITMMWLDEVLELALLLDRNSETHLLSVEDSSSSTRPYIRIREVTLDPGASISPATPHLPKYPACVLAGERSQRGIRIYFDSGTPSIFQAVERIFDFADPTFDVRRESDPGRYYTPHVSFEISSGIEGIEDLAASLERILVRYRFIDVSINVEYNRSSAPDGYREEGQPLPSHLETGFLAFMTSMSEVYRRQWPTMRASRGGGHDLSSDPMFYFDLTIEPDNTAFLGDIQDTEEHAEGESGFSVKAEYWDRPESRVLLQDRYQGRGHTL